MEFVFQFQAALLEVFELEVRCDFGLDFNTHHVAVYVVVFIKKPCKVPVGQFKCMYLLSVFGELVIQIVLLHALPPGSY